MMAQLTSRVSNDVSNWNKLCISSGVATIRTKFPRTVRVDPSTDAIEAAISICCIGCNQLVWIAAELNSSFSYQVQQGKFII
jgi:hypothetical protein